MPRRPFPKNVSCYRDRHGKLRWRYRKAGVPTYHFRSSPGTIEFAAEYDAACNAKAMPRPRFVVGSVDALCEAFYGSPKWLSMKPSSQKTYRGIIERWRSRHGDKPIARLEPRHIVAMLSAMKDTPAAANNLRKALARLFRYAMQMGWIDRNPVDATDPFEIESDGWHAWTEQEIEAFQSRWPMGSRERLALELLLWTGLRKSDVIGIGRQHRDGSFFKLRHGKNRSDVVLPIAPPVFKAIDAMGPASHLTYLVTELGKPFTAAGFGNWFKRACVRAGIPHCTAHGLRKALSRRAVESGSNSKQGSAITGHKSTRTFDHYAKSAEQKALAAHGMANLVEKFAKGDE